MLRFLRNVFLDEKIRLKCFFISREQSHGTLRGSLYFPSISYNEYKNEEEVNEFFKQTNEDDLYINIDAANQIKYYSSLDSFWILLRIKKRKMMILVIDTSSIESLEYLIALITSRAFFLHHRTNINIKSQFIFIDNDELNKKLDEIILPDLVNKLALISLKNNPNFANLGEKQLKQIIKDNPEHTDFVLDTVKSMWVVNNKNN